MRFTTGRRRCLQLRKAAPSPSPSRDDEGPGAFGDPTLHGSISHGSREVARRSAAWVAADRKGKPKGRWLR